MAEFYGLFTLTGVRAAANLTAHQYTLVRLSAAGRVNQASDSANVALLGVLQNKPTTDQHATVADFGVSKIVAGAATTVGAYVTTNSSGRGIDATSGTMIIGRWLEAAAADGDIVSARIHPAIPYKGAVA
jgi:hypothetical protein